MNQNEKELVLTLCRFQNPNRKALWELIGKGAMTSAVLGELFWNRADAALFLITKFLNSSESFTPLFFSIISKIFLSLSSTLNNHFINNLHFYLSCLSSSAPKFFSSGMSHFTMNIRVNQLHHSFFFIVMPCITFYSTVFNLFQPVFAKLLF